MEDEVQEDIPGVDPPKDQSLKELSLFQVRLFKKAAREFIALKFNTHMASFATQLGVIGSEIYKHLGTVSLAVALLAAVVAIPVALNGLMLTLYTIVPCMLVTGLLGFLGRGSGRGKAGMIVSCLVVMESAGAVFYFQQQQQTLKKQIIENMTATTRNAVEQKEAEMKAAEARVKKASEDNEAKIAAESAAKKAEDEKANVDWARQQKLNAEQKERKEREEKKLAEQAVLEKQRAEEEVRRKKESAEAAQEEKKLQNVRRLLAEDAYKEKALMLEEKTANLSVIVNAMRTEKDEMSTQQTILDRADSPQPPSESELAKAQGKFNTAKKEWDRLNALLPAAKTALDNVVKEKDAAAKALDAFGK